MTDFACRMKYLHEQGVGGKGKAGGKGNDVGGKTGGNGNGAGGKTGAI